MSTTRKVLIAGESWVTHSIHQKGFDSFTTTAYEEGVGPLRDALEAGDFEVTYLPNHVAATDFPDTAAALADYAAVILSDIDFFKPYNDNYGHQQGDDTLRAVVNALAGGINRPGDL